LRARISDTVRDLLIQRDAIGIPEGNVEWVLRTYGIPQEIVSKLGLRQAAYTPLRSAARKMHAISLWNDAASDL
jgi:hypothetical protein